MSVAEPMTEKKLVFLMKLPLVLSTAILFALGADLAILSDRTDRFFAWTIKPPLTSLSLAGFYLSAFLILALALRGWTWGKARIVLPGGITFSVLAVTATFIHADKFHLDSSGLPRAITWFWIIAYLLLAPALLVAVPAQLKAAGSVLSGSQLRTGERGILLIPGILLVVVGVTLFVSPRLLIGAWPWELTALTARVLGAWHTGLGLVFLYAGWDADRIRTTPAFAGLIAFGFMQTLAMLSASSFVRWNGLAVWLWLGLMLFCVSGGLFGVVSSRRAQVAA